MSAVLYYRRRRLDAVQGSYNPRELEDGLSHVSLEDEVYTPQYGQYLNTGSREVSLLYHHTPKNIYIFIRHHHPHWRMNCANKPSTDHTFVIALLTISLTACTTWAGVFSLTSILLHVLKL